GRAPPEASHQVGQGARDQEVLLHEAQPLTLCRRIVWIEHPRQRFGLEGLGEGTHEVAVAELLEVEVVLCRGGPEAQGIDGLPPVAAAGPIERYADQGRGPARDGVEGTATHLERAVQATLEPVLWAGDLPRVRTTEPVVRVLPLPAVLDRLPEHA